MKKTAKKAKARVVKNVQEFLDEMGAQNLFHAGRMIYKHVSCGPWTSFLLATPMIAPNGKEPMDHIYYECSLASDTPKEMFAAISGIKVGSIVEGSDVECDGFTIQFPFDMNDFWEKVEEVNKEASFYWERDNSVWLKVVSPSKKDYYFHIRLFGDIAFETIPHQAHKLRKLVEDNMGSLSELGDSDTKAIDGYEFSVIDMGMMTF